MKAVPGPFPLIVTAADPLSSADFQFEGEAVCVPMVSSTGHGHASLKRVHYASGQFAVANIITALQAKPGVEVSMKWLWLYLDHYRDRVIVPLMKGTANVSLSQKALSTALIQIPPLDAQRRIVDLIGALDDAIEAADRQKTTLSELVSGTASAIWREGAPVALGDLGTLVTGTTPSTKDDLAWSSSDVPFVTPADVPWTGQLFDSASAGRFVSAEAAAVSKRRIDDLGVLQVCIGATVGKVGVISGPCLFNQQINAVLGLSFDDSLVLAALMGAPVFQQRIQIAAGSSTMPLVSKGAWAKLEISWPDETRRKAWSSRLQALHAADAASLENASKLQKLRSNLLTALLSGEHEIPESYDELMEV